MWKLHQLFRCLKRYTDSMTISAGMQIERDGFFIPEDVKDGQFTQFATDNLEFHENTKTEPLYMEQHNIYQYLSVDTEVPNVNAAVPLVKKRRTLPNLEYKSPNTYRSPADRKNTKSLSGANISIPEQGRAVERMLACCGI